MKTYTPAPWHVGMKPGPIVYGPLGEQVADLRSDLLPKDEHLSNLKLITSAPILLEALEAILRADIYMHERRDALEKARLAVAKATA